jgi:hypothetical protein
MKYLLMIALLGAARAVLAQGPDPAKDSGPPLTAPAPASNAPQAAAPADRPAVQATTTRQMGDSWSHLQALQEHWRMHVAADSHGRTCNFVSADATSLTCSSSASGQGKRWVFQRADVRSVKLTRRTVSTLAGLGIGGVAGFAIGSAIGHATDPANSGQFLAGLGGAIITGFSTLVGTVGGAVVGGTTDFCRGPVIYQRP